ncbi:MAG: glycogen debranching enzyme GlgX [Hyphomicrobiales bacterium]|nr:MAG: glycogen debranching enzyme GlgX [Hyphomicrobiales bacterium]
MNLEFQSGNPKQLGAHFDGNGTNFTVFSAHATQIDLCVFSPDGQTEIARKALPERTGHLWHGYAKGLPKGTLYGYRAHGAYLPDQGHRFNPYKLLLDPYTRQMFGTWTNHESLLGYDINSPEQDLSYNPQDNANYVPKSVVSDPELFTLITSHPDNAWDETLIYEAHVKGLTQLRPDINSNIRGTYEALASDEMLEYLDKLGITAIELLPVHNFIDDGFLLERKLTNYWGYNSIGFFAPEPRYFGAEGIIGFRNMVAKFHAAGIEVILDVVYNHTAEGDQRGPTLCHRGLDNASYYRLINGQPRFYVNDTGCGNTLNVSNPYVLRMVLDSLRFWHQYMGIDGFRFDLATTLAREDHGYDKRGGFFDAIRQDPVLCNLKLIAEPWDIGPGGYHLGDFPHEFAEWNDTFRDTVRRFWKGNPHSAQELGARLLGSADKFDRSGRRVWASLNFVTAHDGFTLADNVAYNDHHNWANGENNNDGHNNNLSDNCGIEGDTDDASILQLRARRQRNILATLFLSQGTPMLLAGDEIGNSQGGNNNAYCQDNQIGWINWDKQDDKLLQFTRNLTAFRAAHKAVRQSRFLHGGARPADGLPDVEWTDFNGAQLNWRDPTLSTLCLTLRCSAEAPSYEPDDDMVFIIYNREANDAKVTLPKAPDQSHWVRAIDTAAEDEFESREIDPDAVTALGHSVVAFILKENSVI